MAVIKKEETQTLMVKIPRALHDEIDKVRKQAKELSASYDPTESIVKAIRKDLVVAQKALDAMKKSSKESKPD